MFGAAFKKGGAGGGGAPNTLLQNQNTGAVFPAAVIPTVVMHSRLIRLLVPKLVLTCALRHGRGNCSITVI